MPKVTVYVPDDIWSVLREARNQGLQVNFSKLVQEGLWKVLEQQDPQAYRFFQMTPEQRLENFRQHEEKA